MPVRASATDLEPQLSAVELTAIKSLAEQYPKKGKHLEIGTSAGLTLRELMLSYKVPRPPFVVVDPLTKFENQLEIVKDSLRGVDIDPSAVEFRQDLSWNTLQKALTDKEQFDFIFIDSDHRARTVMEDLRWTRLLEKEGFVCLHNYHPGFPGVIWATERFLRKNPNYKMIIHVDTLVVLQKSEMSGDEVDDQDLRASRRVSGPLEFKLSMMKRLGMVPNA